MTQDEVEYGHWDKRQCVLKSCEILKEVTHRIANEILATGPELPKRSEILLGTLLRLRGLLTTLEDLALTQRAEDMGCLLRLMSEWALDCAYLVLADNSEVERFTKYGDVYASRYLKNFERATPSPGLLLPDELTTKLHANAKQLTDELDLPEKGTSWSKLDTFSRAVFIDARYSPSGAVAGRESHSFRMSVRGVFASAHIYAHPSWEALIPVLMTLQSTVKAEDVSMRQGQTIRLLSGGAMQLSLLGRFACDTQNMPLQEFFSSADSLLLRHTD